MAVGKGSLLRAANATARAAQKAGKRSEEEKAADMCMPDGADTYTAFRADRRELRLDMAPAAALREIPEEWRDAGYVRPNVSELAASVSRWGILEPLPAVAVADDVYQLVGGSRRMEVVKMLGIEAVPVVILPGSSLADAQKIYRELHAFSDTERDRNSSGKIQRGKKGADALFGQRRMPEYLL